MIAKIDIAALPKWKRAAWLALAAIFVSDFFTPMGFAHGALYVLPVVIAGLARDRRLIIVIGILAGLATMVGGMLAPPPATAIPPLYAIGNRLVSLIAIAASCWLAQAMLDYLAQVETVRREAAEADEILGRQRDLLQIAGAIGQFGGWAVRLSNRQLSWSGEVGRIFGLAADAPEPSLESAFAAYVSADRDRVRQTFEDCASAGIPFDEEAELRRTDGSTAWVRTIGHPVRDTSGAIVEVRGAFQDISARKTAEQSLDQAQRHFRIVADSLPLIIWTATVDGQVDYHNRALFDYTGLDESQGTPADRWLRAVHDEDLSPTLRCWDEAVTTEQPYLVQFRLRRYDGTYRWFLTRAIPERDGDGRIAKWYGSSMDIDDQKRLEAEARSLALRHTTTLESITDAFITLDRDWRITFLNGQAERLLDRGRDALLGAIVWEAFPAARGTRFEREYRSAITGGRSVHFEECFEPLDKWFEISAYPSSDGLAIYFRDISERRATNAQLHLLQSAVARLGDIIVIAEAVEGDAHGPRIVFVNDAFARMTGYTREEAIGRRLGFMAGADTDSKEVERVRAALAAWRPVRTELLAYTKSGNEIWLEMDVVPLAANDGRYTHWVSVERDITQRLSLENQLRQSQRLEAVGQLTGGIAHDFNNLLTVILGNAEVLAEELVADRDHSALAEMIAGAAMRGAELTGRLLAFARKQALDPSLVDVNLLVGDVEPLLRRTLGEHIEIELVRGAGLWQTLIDAGQLEDALLNLSLNARDAMSGGGRLTIETANTRLGQDYAELHPYVQPGQYVLVAVSDTGDGIAPELLNRVFEPFFSTKEKGKGTGLGLSMVYGFIKQSGGHINIYSEIGQGTTVKMYLPRAQGAAQARDSSVSAGVSAGGSETVLLVEDDALVRRYARAQLVALGYRVHEADNGPRALEILAARDDIDLLFTDVVMPGGMSGRDLADRAQALHPRINILFTSGYTENAIVHQGRLDPGVRLLNKPYRRAELARAVREALA